MDRKNPQLAKLQESFINHLVAPLCNAYAESGLMPGVWVEPEGGSNTYSSDESPMEEQLTPKSEENDDDEDYSRSTNSDASERHRKRLRKIFCLQTKHLQDNHTFWVNRIKVILLFLNCLFNIKITHIILQNIKTNNCNKN